MRNFLTHTLSLLLLFQYYCTTTKTLALAQPAAAAAPAPPGPTNITGILEKAGQYQTFIRLLKSTQVANQINNELNNTQNGLTIFAPTDNAFSSLPSGTLNSLTDQQKDSLIQYHILPYFLSASQFQTVSNPLRTQAGDSSDGQYPLNVTAVGNQVNISTGLVNTTVDNTVYTDGQLAVYQVDQVLLPLGVFRPSVPPAPSPSEQQKKKKSASAAEGPASTTPADSTSGSLAMGVSRDNHILVFAVVSVASIWWSL
ncbi:fasciclin-like arabinogalactan protein 12 [Ananas comosus]|uniref:Fasciclin-like arabinogalactan protein 11 n=1 Tax=Ananas comosus TaxID=4615 RepID=A0A199UZG7_ANACO|nr:fasciclin-like arabinogalactan protein 12 [Ananas comosus]OAY70202.1 Fasciclin-like arabinogalactan protein 11 [Ananas comosus]